MDTPLCEVGTGLKYLGTTYGYPIQFQQDVVDKYVRKALRMTMPQVLPYMKGWTRSGGNLDLLRQSVSKYNRQYPKLPRDPLFAEAVRIARDAFYLPKAAKPIRIDEVRVSKPSSSAGWTWHHKGNRVHDKGSVHRDAIYEALKLKKLIRQKRLSKRALPPCLTFKRTQLAESWKPKLRNVWAYPFELILLEGQYAQPLLEAYASFDGPFYAGKTQLKELPSFIDFCCGIREDGSRRYAVGIDWSGFDSSVAPGLISIAFDIIRANLLLTDQQSDELEMIEWYFTKTPLCLPDGQVYVKFAGVPSGSNFTSLVDSIVNFIVIVYLQLKNWGTWSRTKVYGDDSIFSVPEGKWVNLDQWAVQALQVFGMKLNTTKSVITFKASQLEFLGHKSVNGRVSRDDIKLFRLLMYPEYPVKDPGISVARVQELVVDSGYNSHPMLRLYHTMLARYGVPKGETTRFELYVLQNPTPRNRIPAPWEVFSRT